MLFRSGPVNRRPRPYSYPCGCQGRRSLAGSVLGPSPLHYQRGQLRSRVNAFRQSPPPPRAGDRGCPRGNSSRTQTLLKFTSSTLATTPLHCGKPPGASITGNPALATKRRLRKKVQNSCVLPSQGELQDRKSTRLNSSHVSESRMPSSA